MSDNEEIREEDLHKELPEDELPDLPPEFFEGLHRIYDTLYREISQLPELVEAVDKTAKEMSSPNLWDQLQILADALADENSPLRKALEEAKKKSSAAADNNTKPKKRTPRKDLSKSAHLTPDEAQQRLFYNLPISAPINAIIELLGAGAANLQDLPVRKKAYNHGSKYSLTGGEGGKSRQLSIESKHSSVTIELSDIDKIPVANTPAKKLFALSLIKANDQVLHNSDLLGRDYVTFPLQELVDIGFYKTIQSARKGFYDGMDALTSLKLKGSTQQRYRKDGQKAKTVSINTLQVLFTGATIDNSQCFIYLNNRINWQFIAQQFTTLPMYYFKLPNRASDLLLYIFCLARQHTADIEREGSFNISFRAIHTRLQLPSEIGCRKPQQFIRQPIEDAIEQIETEHSALYNNQEFSLLPVYDDLSNISEFLDNGYLKVSLTGDFSKNFIAISHDATKLQERNEKRRERITERALAMHEAKKMNDQKTEE